MTADLTTAPPVRAARSAPARRGHKRPWWLIPLGMAAVGTVAYVLPPYLPPSMATSRIPETNTLSFALLLTHIFTASVALLAGTVQFWPWLRRRFPKAHRWTGRTYLFIGVLPSAIVAVPVALNAPFGFSNQFALILFAVLWFGTGIAAYRTARARKFAEHRNWMIRNYALTFGAVTSRVWQVIFGLTLAPTGNADITVFTHDLASASSWLGMVVNLVVAEWYLQRRYGVRSRAAAAR